jgi:transcriptional regulator with XRE-family HTH domain
MPTWETSSQRAARRAITLLRRVGEELRVARQIAGLSSRRVAALSGISHTQVLRIERGVAPHVDVDVLARMAASVGHDLSLRIYPSTTPVRDAAHLALLARFAARIGKLVRWRTEVPIPEAGDPRSADGFVEGSAFDAIVEAETRLHDVQAVERRLRAKQRDLGATRAILLVADTRHNRKLLASFGFLADHFPIGTRACLAALARGRDPGGDCLVIL